MSARTRYYRYRPYKSSTSFARRQQRAADQQRDSTTVVINSNDSFDCGQTINQIYLDRGDSGWYDTGCCAINIYDVLRRSDYFAEFSRLYDQFKIDNIRAKIIATNWATSREESSTEKINEIIKARSYVIVTAWDRAGIEKDQIVRSQEWINDPYTPENKKFYVTLGKNITTYSSAKTKHLGPGNAYEIVRQLYPENLQEKNQYISTSLLKRQQTRVNSEYFPYNCFYKKVVPVTPQNPNGYEYVATDFDSRYPCNLLADTACPFKPTLLVDVISGPNPMVTDIKERDPEGFDTLLTIGINKIKPVTFDVEYDITVTFRGLRYNRNIDVNVVMPAPPVVPLYPNAIISENKYYRIQSIEISDSKYKNKSIIVNPYNFGGTIERAALPNEEKNRFVFWLETSTEVVGDNVKYGLYGMNCRNNAINIRFTPTQIYLFDYIDDQIILDQNINYINIKFNAYDPNNINQIIPVYQKSLINNIYWNPDFDVTDKLFKDIPINYVYNYVNQPGQNTYNYDDPNGIPNDENP